MRTLSAMGIGLGLALFGAPATGYADSLHIFCWGATSCSNNSTPNLQTSTNPPQFGVLDAGNGVTLGTTVTTSGKKTITTTITDDLVIDILDPTINTTHFTASALSPFQVTISGTNKTFNSTNPTQSSAFTGPGGAKLSSYLFGGNDHFNSNPFSAITLLSPNKGFWVYQVDLGPQTLGNNETFKLDISPLDKGAVILAFLTETETVKTCQTGKGCTTTTSHSYTSTANSEMLFEDGRHLQPTPVPAALPLLAGGIGVLGVFGWRKKRKAAAAA